MAMLYYCALTSCPIFFYIPLLPEQLSSFLIDKLTVSYYMRPEYFSNYIIRKESDNLLILPTVAYKIEIITRLH